MLTMLLLVGPVGAKPANATPLSSFVLNFHDPYLSSVGYVAEVGYENSLLTPYDDEVLFGRGEAILAPGPWPFTRFESATFSAYSSTDDPDFDAVVAQLTDGIDEQLSVIFYEVRCIAGSCHFKSSQVSAKLESEWFGGDDLTGAPIGEIRFDWVPTNLPDTTGTVTISLLAVPEPSTGALTASGLLLLRLSQGRRRP
jgi:hypothetical protein